MKYPLCLLMVIFVLVGCTRPDVATPVPPTQTPYVVVATPTPLAEADLAILDAEDQLIANLYERLSPAVVHIKATVLRQTFFFGAMPEEGTGSGFIFDTQGHIVTNYHVIEGASTVEVQFNDGQQLTAEVVGIDPPNDLAVLRVANLPQLTPLPIGDSSTLRVGQRAIAIGNPFGLDSTLTTGVISALGRPLQISQDQYIYNVIQTDAAINPGNSGGPLLNSRGELIGVNTAIRQGAEGIGFAVPAEIVQRVVPVLIETGRYPHPWLGLLGYSITPDLAQALELPVESGILIAQLYQGGPAVKAGVRGATQEAILGYQRLLIGGDILTAIDGVQVQNWNQLQQYLQTQTQVGDVVTLTLLRDGQTFTQTLTLEAQP